MRQTVAGASSSEVATITLVASVKVNTRREGAYGAAVPSGINSFAVGQAQHDVPSYYNTPAFEFTPLNGAENLVASQPREGRVVVSDWRYCYANGEWFYQMLDNSWMRWENGTWVNAATTQPNVARIASPTLQIERR